MKSVKKGSGYRIIKRGMGDDCHLSPTEGNPLSPRGDSPNSPRDYIMEYTENTLAKQEEVDHVPAIRDTCVTSPGRGTRSEVKITTSGSGKSSACVHDVKKSGKVKRVRTNNEMKEEGMKITLSSGVDEGVASAEELKYQRSERLCAAMADILSNARPIGVLEAMLETMQHGLVIFVHTDDCPRHTAKQAPPSLTIPSTSLSSRRSSSPAASGPSRKLHEETPRPADCGFNFCCCCCHDYRQEQMVAVVCGGYVIVEGFNPPSPKLSHSVQVAFAVALLELYALPNTISLPAKLLGERTVTSHKFSSRVQPPSEWMSSDMNWRWVLQEVLQHSGRTVNKRLQMCMDERFLAQRDLIEYRSKEI